MITPMRNYLKEEDFIDEFYGWAAAASDAVNNQWRPNDRCNDAARKQADYFMKSGEMTWLAFSSASVHRPSTGDAYAQIILESSSRIVNVWVSSPHGKTEVKIQIDRLK